MKGAVHMQRQMNNLSDPEASDAARRTCDVERATLFSKHYNEIKWFLGVILILFAAAVKAQTSSPEEATAVGVPCKTRIIIGEGYVTGTESVEARITILELVRGERAWEQVKAAGPSNLPPNSGMEYVCARIRFEYGTKGEAGELTYGIRDEQFASVSESGEQYERPAIVAPRPELNGRLYPGESLEGWIVLLVSVEDKKPLMTFGYNYYRNWFKLYR
jgi:hypothetical protein